MPDSKQTDAREPESKPPRKIDGKFSTDGVRIFNTVSGEPIPDEEPLFLLRGRDKFALHAIDAYQAATEGQTNDLHQAGIQQVREKFCRFAAEYAEHMKEPGVTRHLKLEPAAPIPASAEAPAAQQNEPGQSVNFMQQLPGGVCFAHGPYKDTVGCPKWPACITDPQKPEYVAMGKAKLASSEPSTQAAPAPAAKNDPEAYLLHLSNGRRHSMSFDVAVSIMKSWGEMVAAHVSAQQTAELRAKAKAEIKKYEKVSREFAPGHINCVAALERKHVWEEILAAPEGRESR